MALSGSTEINQIERTADMFQTFLTDMKVGRRGREPAMTEQSLKG
jgi:hypothetical protein